MRSVVTTAATVAQYLPERAIESQDDVSAAAADEQRPPEVQPQKSTPLHFNIGLGITDNKPKPTERSWKEFCEQYKRPVVEKDKTRANYFMFARLDPSIPPSPGKNGHRENQHVVEMTAFVLDLDHGNVSKSKIEELCGGYEYFAHTTWRSMAEERRWRVIFPALKPFSPWKLPALHEHFNGRLKAITGGRASLDPGSKTPAHAWFVPSIAQPGADFESFVSEGKRLNADEFAEPKHVPTKLTTPGVYDPAPEVVREALSSIKLKPAADGGYYGHWRDIGMSFNDWCNADDVGFEIFDAWSSGQPRYVSTADVRKHWDSWQPGGGICIGTALRIAQNEGWERPKEVEASRPKAAPISHDPALVAEVEELANMLPLDYEMAREEVAKRLGIRGSVLDDAVSRRRAELARASEEAQEVNLFPTVEPWTDPVNGEELLDELAESVNRFVKLPDHTPIAIALWVAFTYLHDSVDISPILAVQSPQKRCGKTTTMEWLQKTCHRPLSASNITPSVVYHVVEMHKPAMLIDEGDSFLGENEQLRGILNSGHKRSSAWVWRNTGDTKEGYTPQGYSTWCPKAIALIKELPDTLQDRSIVVPLRRKLTSETVERVRDVAPEHFDTLRRKLLRWSKDNEATIRGLRPTMPRALNDRAADNWEPLFCIATAAGGKWPKLAEDAALALSSSSEEGESNIDLQLLSDIRNLPLTVWGKAGSGFLYQRSGVLASMLCNDESLPWATIAHGKALTANSLTRRLKPFGIKPSAIRFGTKPEDMLHGYRRDWFKDAWERYIPEAA